MTGERPSGSKIPDIPQDIASIPGFIEDGKNMISDLGNNEVADARKEALSTLEAAESDKKITEEEIKSIDAKMDEALRFSSIITLAQLAVMKAEVEKHLKNLNDGNDDMDEDDKEAIKSLKQIAIKATSTTVGGVTIAGNKIPGVALNTMRTGVNTMADIFISLMGGEEQFAKFLTSMRGIPIFGQYVDALFGREGWEFKFVSDKLANILAEASGLNRKLFSMPHDYHIDMIYESFKNQIEVNKNGEIEVKSFNEFVKESNFVDTVKNNLEKRQSELAGLPSNSARTEAAINYILGINPETVKEKEVKIEGILGTVDASKLNAQIKQEGLSEIQTLTVNGTRPDSQMSSLTQFTGATSISFPELALEDSITTGSQLNLPADISALANLETINFNALELDGEQAETALKEIVAMTDSLFGEGSEDDKKIVVTVKAIDATQIDSDTLDVTVNAESKTITFKRKEEEEPEG